MNKVLTRVWYSVDGHTNGRLSFEKEFYPGARQYYYIMEAFDRFDFLDQLDVGQTVVCFTYESETGPKTGEFHLIKKIDVPGDNESIFYSVDTIWEND